MENIVPTNIMIKKGDNYVLQPAGDDMLAQSI